jgi:hypothetical protein
MKHAFLAPLALVVLAQSGAAASDDAALFLAESESLRLSNELLLAEPAPIEIGVQLQARYDLNFRDDDSTTLADPDDDTTLGFSIRRLKVDLAGQVTDSISANVVFAFDRSSGESALENAFADWEFSEANSLRIGQFKLPFLREETVSSKRQLAAERSSMNETFNQDFSQGVQWAYAADAWRFTAAFSDGFGADNTAFDSDSEADWAVTARAEFKFGDAAWKQFGQFTSFRGATAGGLLGVAGHFESEGDTNPSDPDSTEIAALTADFGWVADGWNVYGAGVYRHTDDGTATLEDFGALVQGGLFVSDQAELFARWSAVFPDSERGATGEDYSDVGVGVNYYIVPESHAAKLTVGVNYTLDATSESIVSTSTGHNLLADSEDGQVAVTAQFQFLF